MLKVFYSAAENSSQRGETKFEKLFTRALVSFSVVKF